MRTCKRTPIRLSADFSAETLQTRREWHDIFKVMKRTNLQPCGWNILPSKTLLQIWWIKSFLDKPKLREFSFTTNARGTSLSRKHKRRKRPTQNKPKPIQKMVIGSYILTITLDVNVLNAPTKRDRLLGRWKHEHACISTYHITLFNPPNCI